MHPPDVPIRKAPAMLIAGIRRVHKMTEAATTVPQAWNEFRTRNISSLRGSVSLRVIGAYCSMSNDGFEYLAGVEVESFDNLPPDVGRMRVPEQTYAVFTHRGHASQIGQTWQYIWAEWLPQSGYEDGMTPPFEQFDERFDPDTGNGEFDIWMPIRKRNTAG
jgi:AraC family transcriptional regulator